MLIQGRFHANRTFFFQGYYNEDFDDKRFQHLFLIKPKEIILLAYIEQEVTQFLFFHNWVLGVLRVQTFDKLDLRNIFGASVGGKQDE